MSTPYFINFYHREPPDFPPMSPTRRYVWHLFVGLTLGFGVWYIVWRWAYSLNPDALVFSSVVATCETLALLGSALFFYDTWDEGDTPIDASHYPQSAQGQKVDVTVDVFIATYDETESIVEPTIEAAKELRISPHVDLKIFLLDDGNREEMAELANKHDIGYFARSDNRGFKAGNLSHAIFQTEGDFFIICDADTQLFPSFLQNTLCYFGDEDVSWVQTPHWFYELSEGRSWREVVQQALGERALFVAPFLELFSGSDRFGKDHFLADASLFFDVIQRRRNRNGASFCCGAASIHRREAVLENALIEKGRKINKAHARSNSQSPQIVAPRIDLKPFEYHVSEDILTSIQSHGNGWRSVYHPKVEARMLSPWTASAWAVQKLKYAGGTFDIFLHANPLLKKGMRPSVRLHYLATFWSYFTVFFVPVLLLAPAWSLITGTAPVQAYSLDFFAHLLPALICNEIAMLASSKGHSHQAAKTLAIGTFAIQLRAFFLVAFGRKPQFPPTPKLPNNVRNMRYAVPSLALLTFLLMATIWGLVALSLDVEGYSLAFFLINVFWILWSGIALLRIVYATSVCPAAPRPIA